MGYLSRLADRLDRKLDTLKAPTPEQLRERRALRKRAEKPWMVTVWEPEAGKRFKTKDGKIYGWLPPRQGQHGAQLRVSRGVWPKGHAGKVARKQFNRLHKQGHHSVTTCFEILAARAARAAR